MIVLSAYPSIPFKTLLYCHNLLLQLCYLGFTLLIVCTRIPLAGATASVNPIVGLATDQM